MLAQFLLAPKRMKSIQHDTHRTLVQLGRHVQLYYASPKSSGAAAADIRRSRARWAPVADYVNKVSGATSQRATAPGRRERGSDTL
ncbi:hypothetical protein Pcac1_g7303 [Phytophthora cactorum]|uniref:Uncharacterized protein n=3 Tax=Phytophthora cactorum TaxID=29920 RepID=A0A8T1F3S7_9STRA|nr:hypothetical protein Pcac1_g7303 [Phytophthora cactorum]KAG2964009.1 hypothetical protein PC118_g20580 [Phytophthora cactorum]